uniref:RNA-directed DNA polymerase n=1 Tax=Globodera rostochiensis TaxID=31243 RepID=A0A914H882_GLORO
LCCTDPCGCHDSDCTECATARRINRVRNRNGIEHGPVSEREGLEARRLREAGAFLTAPSTYHAVIENGVGVLISPPDVPPTAAPQNPDDNAEPAVLEPIDPWASIPFKLFWERECVVCLSSVPRTYGPCGHVALCVACSVQMDISMEADQNQDVLGHLVSDAGSVLSQNDGTGGNAEPSDRSRPRTKNNRFPLQQKDDRKQLSSPEMLNNMADYRDTIQPIDFAPSTKQLMQLCEHGRTEKMFSLPVYMNWLLDPGIIRSHLVSPSAMDSGLADELQQDLQMVENTEDEPVGEHGGDGGVNVCYNIANKSRFLILELATQCAALAPSKQFKSSANAAAAAATASTLSHSKRSTKRFLKRQRERKGRVFIRPQTAPQGVKPNKDEEFEIETIHAMFVSANSRKAYYIAWLGFAGKDSWSISEDVEGLELVQSFTEVTAIDSAMDALSGTPIAAHFSKILTENPKFQQGSFVVKAVHQQMHEGMNEFNRLTMKREQDLQQVRERTGLNVPENVKKLTILLSILMSIGLICYILNIFFARVITPLLNLDAFTIEYFVFPICIVLLSIAYGSSAPVLYFCRSYPRKVFSIRGDLGQFFGNESEAGSRVIAALRFLRPPQQTLRSKYTTVFGADHRQFVYWPRITTDIERWVRNCPDCASAAKAPPNVLLRPWPSAGAVYERLHMDFAGPCSDGFKYLVVVDAHSKWPEVIKMNATSASFLITQLTSKGIKQTFSPPFQPQSNGQAERFVDILKRQMRKCAREDKEWVQNSLLAYPSTPSEVLRGRTPAELFLGRTIRTVLSLVKPGSGVQKGGKFHQDRDRMCRQFDRRHGTHRPFNIGDRVLFLIYRQNKRMWLPGEVVGGSGVVWKVWAQDLRATERPEQQQIPRTPSPERQPSPIQEEPSQHQATPRKVCFEANLPQTQTGGTARGPTFDTSTECRCNG